VVFVTLFPRSRGGTSTGQEYSAFTATRVTARRGTLLALFVIFNRRR
jgi:hypothetical protein